MKHVFFLSVALLTVFIGDIVGNHILPNTYKAAVVEFNAISSPIHDNVVQNERQYEVLMEDAKQKGAEIIIFPECGLLSLADEVDMTEVPDPSTRTAPCDDTSGAMEALKKLSCAARQHQMYTVLNLEEIVDCSKYNGPECLGRMELHYNTNVVLDRNGTVIARHRKYHRFAEEVDRPLEPEVTNFDTDFGVRFGMLICFEILFEYPGRTLVEDLQIKNIILTTAWSSSFPYHAGLQTQYGWAHRHNVNLLVAGLNNPKTGSSGSGLFRGRQGVVEYIVTDLETTKVIVGDLYKEVDGPSSDPPKMTSGGDVPSNGLSVLGALEEGSHELIEHEIFHKVACHRELCCHFDISLNHSNGNSFYRAYVFDGVADFQGMATGGTQSCLVVSCSDQTIGSCAKRDLNLGTFNALTISGNFRRNHSLQIPSAIRQEGSLGILHPAHMNHTVHCHDNICRNVITILQPTSQLLTFGIYGRDYTKDGLPPDDLIIGFRRSLRDYGDRRRRRRRKRRNVIEAVEV